MPPELEEINRLVGTMPRDMAREVLNFARYLQRKHEQGTDSPTDWDDDGSRYGFGPVHPMERWDLHDSPAAGT
jgi:hypothetical protein